MKLKKKSYKNLGHLRRPRRTNSKGKKGDMGQDSVTFRIKPRRGKQSQNPENMWVGGGSFG